MKNIKLLTYACLMMFPVGIATGISKTKTNEVKAENQVLTFNQDNWNIASGVIELTNENSITVTTSNTSDNPLLLEAKTSYDSYHLQYTQQWAWGTGHNNQIWTGLSGIILNESYAEDGLNGYYVATYEWGGAYCAAFGYFHNGVFNQLSNGIEAGWGFNECSPAKIDIYVQDDFANILINDWLFTSMRLPYESGHKVAIRNVLNEVTYSNVILEELPANYDIYSHAERNNWGGFNIVNTQYYSQTIDNHHMFTMKLPNNRADVSKLYLARTTKVSDTNQNADVYLNKTGTLNFDSEWTNKVASWNDWNSGEASSDFVTTTVELDKTAFEGVNNGQEVQFLIKKTADGWYGSSEYWLIYETNDEVQYIADYMSLAYQFDRESHNFASVHGNQGCDGTYTFYRNNGDTILSSRVNNQLHIYAKPVITALVEEITHEFSYLDTDTEYALNLDEIVKIDAYHHNYKVTLKFDEGEESETIALPRDNKIGKMYVVISPDGSANDNSGNISWTPVSCEINYTTTIEPVPICSVQILNEEEVIANIDIQPGMKIFMVDYTATKEGYTLVGWSDGEITYALDAEIVVEHNMIIRAIFEKNEPIVDPDDLEEPTKPEEPEKKGCKGSVIASSIIVSTIALAGAILVGNKKKED